jgi:hypothetical protein
MLGKLMKYEFKAMARVFLPLYAALLVMSIVNMIIGSFRMETPTIIGGVVSTILIVGIIVLTLILTLQRFRKNLLGKEGYLMLTLPVPTDYLILSKLFVSSIWCIASTVVVTLSVVIMAATDLDVIVDGLKMLLIGFSYEPLQGTFFAIEILFGIVLGVFSGVLLLYASMAASMLVNNHRGLFSFAAFIVFSTIVQIFSAILISLGVYLGLTEVIEGLIDAMGSLGVTHLAILIYLIVQACYCAVFYFITRYMLKCKLNLQ